MLFVVAWRGNPTQATRQTLLHALDSWELGYCHYCRGKAAVTARDSEYISRHRLI